MQYLGDFAEDDTVLIPFNTFSSDDPQASVTITNLADGDLHVHKDGSADEIVTDGATIVINFDGITGNHVATIDTSAHADYSTGSEYMVRMEGTTVDGGTINAWIGSFSIENRFMRGTDSAYTGTPPTAAAIVDEWETQSQADPTGFHVNLKEADSQTVSAAAGVTFNAELGASATAMDNFEDQYDTTGLVGDTFPATQAQASNLTVAGSASKVPVLLSPNGFVIAFGENEVNNEDVTRPLDGITHDIEAQDDTGTERIDVYYVTNTGAGIPSEVTWHGRLDRGGGASKNIDVQAEDVDASTWRTIGNVVSSTTLETHTFDIFINEVGTGASLGEVNIRFVTGSVAFSSTTKLLTDQIFCSFNAGSVSSLAAVFFDSNASNTGTTSNDGIPGNPVSTEAAVNTLLAARNLNEVEVSVGSSITFATDHAGETWQGHDWIAVGGSRDFSNAHMFGANVSGIWLVATGEIDLHAGIISTATMDAFHMTGCGYDGTLTLGAAGNYVISDGHSAIAGDATPIIDFDTAVGVNHNLSMPDYHNGTEIRNFNNQGTDKFSISGTGQIIYAASSSGTVNQRGKWLETNTGGVTIVRDGDTQNAIDILVDTAAMQPLVAKIPLSDGTISWNPTALAAILAEVNTALDTAISELGVAAPAATPTLRTGLMLMYMMTRNRVDVDTTGTDAMKIYNNAGTQIASKLLTDDNTDYSEAEMT